MMKWTQMLLITGLTIGPAWVQNLAARTDSPLKKIAPKPTDDSQLKLKKESAAEQLLNQTQLRAISKLEALIKKNASTEKEPELLMRKAELCARQARTLKFLEFYRDQIDEPAAKKWEVNQDATIWLQKASEALKRIFEEYPKSTYASEALFHYALHQEQLGKLLLAEKAYRQLIEKYPNTLWIDDAYIGLGDLLYKQRKFDEALTFYEKVSSKNRKVYGYSRYKSAWTYYNLQETETALSILEKILTNDKIDQGYSLSQEALSDYVLFLSDRNVSEQALKKINQLSISKNKKNKMLLQLAKLYDRYSKYDDALKTYDHLLNSINEPEESIPVLHSRFELFYKQDRSQEGIKDIKTASNRCGNLNWSIPYCEKLLISLKNWTIELWTRYQKNQESKYKTTLTAILDIALKETENQSTYSDFLAIKADLLYQEKNYEQSSYLYQKAFEKSLKPSYLLASLDSDLHIIQSSPKIANRFLLNSNRFINQFPDDENIPKYRLVRLKIFIDQKDYKNAQIELQNIDENQLNNELKILFQNLTISYLNSIGDYVALEAKTRKFLEDEKETERKKQLSEAHADAKTLLDLKTLDEALSDEILSEKIQEILTKDNLAPKSREPVFLKAYLKAKERGLIVLSYKIGEQFIKLYPESTHKKNILENQLKDAQRLLDLPGILHYTRLTLETYPKEQKESLWLTHLELSIVLENTDSLRWTLKNWPNSLSKEVLVSEYYKLKEYKNVKQLQLIEEFLDQNKVEPYYSLKKVLLIEELFKARKYPHAFDGAKPFVSSNNHPKVRAFARLIQAKILEKELNAVGFKTRLDKAPLVIEIKTEKLEKALLAYEDVKKWSQPNDQTYFEALKGTARVYQDFISFCKNFVIKDQVETPSDIKAILEKLQKPIQKKLSEMDKTLGALRKPSSIDFPLNAMSSNTLPSVSEPWREPILRARIVANLLPEHHPQGRCRKSATSKDKNYCFYQKINDLKEWLNAFYDWREKDLLPVEDLAWNQALIAKKTGRNEIYEYLINLTLKMKSDDQDALLELSKIFITQEKWDSAVDILNTLYLSTNDHLFEFAPLVKGFLEKNCHKVVAFSDNRSRWSQEAREHFTPIIAECLSLVGLSDSAIKLLVNESSHLESRLELARIYEFYRGDIKTAKYWYEKAIHSRPEPQTLDWIKRKIQWISSLDSLNHSDTHIEGDLIRE